MLPVLRRSIIGLREGRSLRLGIAHATGLDLLIEEIARHATREYRETSPDAAALDADRMAVSARALGACSWLLVLRQDGQCSIEDHGDVMSLALEMLRSIERMHTDEWPDIVRLQGEHGTDDHRTQLLAIEDVATELLGQMIAADGAREALGEQQDRAEAVVA